MLTFRRRHHQVEQGLKGGSESAGQVTLTSISSRMFISTPRPNTHTSGHLRHCLFIQRTTWRNIIPLALLQPEKHSVIPLNYFVWTSWWVFQVLPNSSLLWGGAGVGVGITFWWLIWINASHKDEDAHSSTQAWWRSEKEDQSCTLSPPPLALSVRLGKSLLPNR